MSASQTPKESVFTSYVKVIPLFIAARCTLGLKERRKTVTGERKKESCLFRLIFPLPTYFKDGSCEQNQPSWSNLSKNGEIVIKYVKSRSLHSSASKNTLFFS